MRSSVSPARSAIIISALGAFLAAGAVILYRFNPATVHFYPSCVFHALTGLQCPGCGTTRALHHLLHGDVAGAFRLNAMLFVAVPFGALASVSRRGPPPPPPRWGRRPASAGGGGGGNIMWRSTRLCAFFFLLLVDALCTAVPSCC